MITEILQHEIEFWLKDENGKLIEEAKLNECDEEHIEEMIKQGCNCGELCSLVYPSQNLDDTKELRGWWKIVKP